MGSNSHDPGSDICMRIERVRSEFVTYSKLLDRVGRHHCVEHFGDTVGITHAGGISQTDLITAHVEQLFGQIPNLPIVGRTGIRASDNDAEIPSHAQSLFESQTNDLVGTLQ